MALSLLDGSLIKTASIAIAKIIGLQTALDGKAAASHTHAQSDVTGLTTSLSGKVDTTRAVNTSGLATGGGALSADRTISVPAASSAEYRVGAETAKALTPGGVWGAAAEVALTDAATVAWDMATGLDFSITLAGNRTLGAPSNPKVGQKGRIRLVQDATGSRTLAYNSVFKFAGGTAPSLTTTANAEDFLFYDVVSSTKIILSLMKDVK